MPKTTISAKLEKNKKIKYFAFKKENINSNFKK